MVFHVSSLMVYLTILIVAAMWWMEVIMLHCSIGRLLMIGSILSVPALYMSLCNIHHALRLELDSDQ